MADVFLHDICKRIIFPDCFFLFAQKRNEKRDSFTTARFVSSRQFFWPPIIVTSEKRGVIGSHHGESLCLLLVEVKIIMSTIN